MAEGWQGQIDEVADLMREFRLAEATLTQGGRTVTFRRRPKTVVVAGAEAVAPDEEWAPDPEPVSVAPVQAGTPVASPMNGIFYSSPSPGSKPFVNVGDMVTAGQVVGLIEAMKVFNEIPSPVSGTVLKLSAESGAVVQPGDPLLYIG